MIKQKSLVFAAKSTIEDVKSRHLSGNTEMSNDLGSLTM